MVRSDKNIPTELLELIFIWVGEFKNVELKEKLNHFKSYFFVMEELNSLPFPINCRNCTEICTQRYICCCNHYCINCILYCKRCNKIGCNNCIDIVDEHKCENCLWVDN